MPRRKFVDEAAAQTLLHFGPELSVLKQLMSEAGTSYRQKVHSATAGASAIEASSARATEQLRGIYGDNPIAGIPGLSRAQALNDMIGRGVAAQESAAGARRTALQELAADRAKINLRRGDISQEIGAFTTSTVGRLGREAAQRDLSNRISLRSTRQSERSSLRSSGINPDTGQPIPGGKLDPKAKKPRRTTATGAAPLSRDKHFEVSTAIGEIASHARRYKGKFPRSTIVAKLTKGRPQARITTDPDTGQRLPNPITVPSIPAYKPDIRMTAALDVALDGHLSRRTQRALQGAGFVISELGLPTYGSFKRAQRRRGPGPPRSAAGYPTQLSS